MTETVDQRGIHLGQNVRVVGASAAVTQVAGDMVNAQTYVKHVHQGESAGAFVELALEKIDLGVVPNGIDTLVGRARQQRFVLLGGSYEEKPAVARQLARYVAEEAFGGGALPVLEWIPSSEPSVLLYRLRTEKDRAVFVLPEIQPHQVGYDLAAVREAASSARHVLIATTEIGRSAWKLGAAEEPLWHALEPDGLFDREALIGALERQLEPLVARLPRDSFEEVADTGGCRLGGVELRTLAERLRTPGNVSVFGQQLAATIADPDATVNAAVIDGLVADATSKDERVKKWFITLPHHQQLLALGLALFAGLYDDQFFAAMERWVTEVRDRRDPSLKAFDYSDLERLENFFWLVEGEVGGTRVESRWPGLRRTLLRTAWGTHRRQIVGALGVLTRLVVDAGEARDWELNGTEERRRRVRATVGEVLSDLGTISLSAVEPALLRLASDRETSVQLVAAEAVARWREFERLCTRGAARSRAAQARPRGREGHEGDAQLFELLARWQREARVRGMMESMLKGRDERDNRGSSAQVRSTIAFAAGFATRHDEPNRLIDPLSDLLRELSTDGNRVVRRRFGGYTLPLAASLHLPQLRGFIRELVREQPDTRWFVGASLAFAYRTAPGEVLATLDAWHAECEAKRPKYIDLDTVSERDGVLMTLAYTYGELEYERGGPLTVETGFGRLQKILATERHPAVRGAVVRAIAEQAENRFAVVETMLVDVLGAASPRERNEIVQIFTRMYLEQRAELEGGSDDEIEVNERIFPVWLDRARPLTDIERAMNRWMKDGAHPAAQQVALQATVSFVQHVDQEEANQVARLRAARRVAARRVANAPAASAGEPGWYSGVLVPHLATLGEPRLEPAVRALLPQAQVHQAGRPDALEFVLSRWERMTGDGGSMGELARRLRSAMWWHTAAWVMIGAGGFILFLFFLFLLPFLLPRG